MAQVSGVLIGRDRDSAVSDGRIMTPNVSHPLPARTNGTGSVAMAIRGEDRLGGTFRPS